MRDFRNLRAAGARWAVALSLTALAPAAATAQDTTTAPTPPQPVQSASGRTHTVRTGDTLWDLARAYLGDPFLWPEIYRVNTEVVEDPHWIYPGETLRLPEGSAAGIAAVGDGQAEAAATGEAPSRAGGTVFAMSAARRRGMGVRRGEDVGRSTRPLIRRGDFHAAPTIAAEGGIDGAGRIGERVEIAEVVRRAGANRLQIGDRMTMSAPRGKVPLQGEQYLVYRLAESLGDRGQVIVPTGIIEVLSGRGGSEAMAQVVEVFDAVRAGQHVTTMERFEEMPFRRAEGVDMGIRSQVLWIESDPMLPSLHQYLLVGSRDTDGVKPGDQFTLYGDDETTSREVLAVAQVIRSTRRGTTLMIIDQDTRGIRVGTPVRLTAKMP
jgi:hypothetical protein